MATASYHPRILSPKYGQTDVAFHRRLRIRLSFEYKTTLLSVKAEEGRTGTSSMFEKILSQIVAKNRRRTLKDTQGEVKAEARLYALANTLEKN